MSWRATAAHRRALLLAMTLALTGALSRRADLVVIAVPFLAVTAWGLATRPEGTPQARVQVDRQVAHEGEVVRWDTYVEAPPGAEDLALRVVAEEYLPASKSPSTLLSGPGVRQTAQVADLAMPLIALRWGPRRAGPGILAATSAMGAFRWTAQQLSPIEIRVLPGKAAFAGRSTLPHPVGVVGLNVGARPGDGSEFATIRAYQPGDRLRRIHWPTTARTGTLQVSTTRAEKDSEVLIVLDAHHDLGHSGGIAGAASSLDRGVRGATALAEHFLGRGDRVGLVVLGAASVAPVPARSGRSHLQRILDEIAGVRPGTSIPRADRHVSSYLAGRVRAGSLVVVLTPGISDDALTVALALRDSGAGMVVVDTLPGAAALGQLSSDDLHAISPTFHRRDAAWTRVAWRLRMLERADQMHRLRTEGVAVVPWTAGGSIDDVLRQLQRQHRSPRLARR